MQKQTVKLNVNGDQYEVAVRNHRSLADVIREDLDLTGTKVGCNQGDCGACTVLIDGRAVCSCLTLAVEAEGSEITTIEGIAEAPDALHPLQQAFVDKGAVQCGFCTGGMIVSAVAMLEKNPKPDDDAIRRGLSGNLCRCTGYNKIVEAVASVADAGSEIGSGGSAT